jgi:hypothetical protein
MRLSELLNVLNQAQEKLKGLDVNERDMDPIVFLTREKISRVINEVVVRYNNQLPPHIEIN